MQVDFYKAVVDRASGLQRAARTWSDHYAARFGSAPQAAVHSALSRIFDHFLARFLKASEAACGKAAEL